MAIVITTCTNRKRQPVAGGLHAGDLGQDELAVVAAEWGERLQSAVPRHPASSIYGGRSFRDSCVAADKAGANLLIVSAGLGLVEATAHVPSYACTVLDGVHDSIAARVTTDFSKADWWEELRRVSPYASSLSDLVGSRNGLILAAMSDGYIEMMLPDFLALPASRLKDLRLFTRAPRDRVPTQLRPYIMPYDDRLDGVASPVRGTRSDFAARALLHFVDNILAANDACSASQHAEAIKATIADWPFPPTFARKRLADNELTALMRKHWADANGSTARLLRMFRDELDIACEQGRFAALARQVRGEFAHG